MRLPAQFPCHQRNALDTNPPPPIFCLDSEQMDQSDVRLTAIWDAIENDKLLAVRMHRIARGSTPPARTFRLATPAIDENSLAY